MRKKINVKIKGERVRQYIYIDKEDKQWLKEEAKKNNMSVSKYLQDLVQKQIEKDLRLKLEFKD